MELLAFLQDVPKFAGFDGWDIATYPGIAIGVSFFIWVLSKFGKIGKLLDGKEEWAVLILCYGIGNLSMFLLGHFTSVDSVSHQVALLGTAITAWIGYDKLVKRAKEKAEKKKSEDSSG